MSFINYIASLTELNGYTTAQIREPRESVVELNRQRFGDEEGDNLVEVAHDL